MLIFVGSEINWHTDWRLHWHLKSFRESKALAFLLLVTFRQKIKTKESKVETPIWKKKEEITVGFKIWRINI